MSFLTEDLLLPDDELDQLRRALSNVALPEPIEASIIEAEGVVTDYTIRYVIGEDRRKRLVRPLAIHALYTLIGTVPDAHQKAYDAAMQELRDIRDGKFGVELQVPETGASQASWGSETKIKPRDR